MIFNDSEDFEEVEGEETFTDEESHQCP